MVASLNNLALAIILAIALCISLSPSALADAGVPMLIIVWPASWMLLFAIIPVESFVAHRLLHIGWKKSFLAVTVANLASTLLGIPITWLLLVGLQMVLGGGGAYGLETDMNKILAVTLQSPWLIPYEQDLSWMIPAAAAVLCVPFLFMSVVVEYFVVRRFIAREDWRLVWRWSWIANAITYGLIISGILVVLVNVHLGTFEDKLGYIDLSGKFWLQPRGTSNNGNYADGLAPVEINGKWGYVNKSGAYVIAPQFEDAKSFSDGLAQVRIGNSEGFINEKGQVVIKPQFAKTKPFTQSLACVCVGKKWGFVDKKGVFIIKPQYDQTASFAEGRAAVKIGDLWSYVGPSGQLVIKPNYETAGKFSEGLACVFSTGNGWQCIDYSGHVVFSMPARCWGENFSEGLAVFSIRESTAGGSSTKAERLSFSQCSIKPNHSRMVWRALKLVKYVHRRIRMVSIKSMNRLADTATLIVAEHL